MAEPHELTALEQAAALRRREFSAVELVGHYLDRIAAGSERVGAFVTITADTARAHARAADTALRAGHDGGPLYGVPTGIKDLTMTAGVRTTFGSAAFADFVPQVDADVVRLLRSAGMISLGKTTTSEFGLSCHAESDVAPPARNPWAPAHTAGGSSGGAAAAVAAGLLPVAHGNDGGGSVRIPAAICGLVGYKPSRGLVSGGPFGFGGFGLATDGAIARTVADAAAMVDAVAVPQPGEPYPPPVRVNGGLLAAARRPYESAPAADAATHPRQRPLRIGRFTAPMLAGVPIDPACVSAVDSAATVLGALGHEVVDVPGLLGPELEARFDTLWAALAVSAPIPPEAASRLQPLTRWMRERGERVSLPALFADLAAIQSEVRRALHDLSGVDLLLCPTLAIPQARVGYFTEAGDPAEDFARQKRFSPYCAGFNVTGQPAVSLPLSTDPNGLPVGVMLAAGLGEDALLLAVAAAVEEASPWRLAVAEPRLP